MIKMLDISCELSLRKQSKLLNINLSGLYYKPKVSDLDLRLMNQIDKIYTIILLWFTKDCSDFKKRRPVNKRMQKLMRVMGIEAIYPNLKRQLMIRT